MRSSSSSGHLWRAGVRAGIPGTPVETDRLAPTGSIHSHTVGHSTGHCVILGQPPSEGPVLEDPSPGQGRQSTPPICCRLGSPLAAAARLSPVPGSHGHCSARALGQPWVSPAPGHASDVPGASGNGRERGRRWLVLWRPTNEAEPGSSACDPRPSPSLAPLCPAWPAASSCRTSGKCVRRLWQRGQAVLRIPSMWAGATWVRVPAPSARGGHLDVAVA